MKLPVIGTGLSGLVGSRIVELLSSEFEFTDMSYDTGVDITDKDMVYTKLKESPAKWIMHLAAVTDVDQCEAEKSLGTDGSAWKVNVGGTQHLVEAAAIMNKKILYVSTDFVFAGSKAEYTETDTPQPVNWYGETKREGEKIVLSSLHNLVVRITYPYRAQNFSKKDFVHYISERLKRNERVTAVVDQIFTPTLIDDIAVALKVLINKSEAGIFHVVGSQSLSPYEAAQYIAETFNFPKHLIDGSTVSTYYQNRAPRPYKLVTKNAKITQLGVRMHTFLDGLQEIKRQGLSFGARASFGTQ